MKVITTGELKNGQSFYVRYLTMEDMDAILALQEKIIKALPNQDFLAALSVEEFLSILQSERLMIGVFVENQMIAFRALLQPIHDDEGLGADIGISEDEYSKIIYSEISNVDPEYRGNGLQTYMGKILMDCVDKRKTPYVLCTVAPFNIASLKDKFALGMEIFELKEKFGGKLRYIFFKNLLEEQVTRTEEITMDMEDIPSQQQLLKEGYRGTSLENKDGKWYVLYRK